MAFIFSIGLIISIYHFGIENNWWQTILSCKDTVELSSDSIEDLRTKLLKTPITRCDVSQWYLFGLSLAGYNILSSIFMAIVCLNFAKCVVIMKK